MKPFTSTSVNLYILARRRKRESEKYKTNIKVENFHIQKPFIKKKKSPNVFSSPFFTLTQRVQVSRSSRESANCQLILSLEWENKKHSPAVQ